MLAALTFLDLITASGAELVVGVVLVVVGVASVLVDAVVGTVGEAAEDVAAQGQGVLRKIRRLIRYLSTLIELLLPV